MIKVSTYRHYKGDLYDVYGTVSDSTNAIKGDRQLVLYRSHKTKELHVRYLPEFEEFVDPATGAALSRNHDGAARSRSALVPRFEPVDDPMIYTYATAFRPISELPESPELPPIAVVLYCPKCLEQHIDEGEFATKPHKVHTCQNQKCGLSWKAALVPTTGVLFLPGTNSRSLTEIASYDEPGSWDRASRGWPEITGDEAYAMYVFANCAPSIPYGNYVLISHRGDHDAKESCLRVRSDLFDQICSDFEAAGKPDPEQSVRRRGSARKAIKWW